MTPEEEHQRLDSSYALTDAYLQIDPQWYPTGNRSQDAPMPSEPITALLIPQNNAAEVREIELPADNLDAMRSKLKDAPERCTFDRGAAMYVGEESALRQRRNDRATGYVLRHSDAAAMGRMKGETPDTYALCGDVIVVGEEAGRMTDVPSHIVETIKAVDLAQVLRQLSHGL